MKKILIILFSVILSCQNTSDKTQKTKSNKLVIGQYSMKLLPNWNNLGFKTDKKLQGKIVVNKKDTLDYFLNANESHFSDSVFAKEKNDSIFYHIELNNKKTEIKFLCLKKDYNYKLLDFTDAKMDVVDDIKRITFFPKKKGIGQTCIYLFRNPKLKNQTLYIGGLNLSEKTENEFFDLIKTLK